MLFNSFLIAASLAVSASAAPKKSKRWEPGWCTFHLHEDRANPHNFLKDDIKIEIQFYDGKGAELYHYPQTEKGDWLVPQDNVMDDDPNSYYILTDLPHEFGFSLINPDGKEPDGFNFEYNGQKFATTSGQCDDSGGWEVSNLGREHTQE